MSNIDNQIPTTVRERVSQNPEWLMRAGMVIGSCVLLIFVGLAILAAFYPQVVCNSFPLLAAIFAFGAALSGAFIGGSAAAQGTLGDRAKAHSLTYSAGGGVAFFLIAFAIFKLYEPGREDCRPIPLLRETIINIDNVHPDLKFHFKKDGFWTKEDEVVHRRDLSLLGLHRSAAVEIELMHKDQQKCSLKIWTETTEEAFAGLFSRDDPSFILLGSKMKIELSEDWRRKFLEQLQTQKDDPKAVAQESDPTCLIIYPKKQFVREIGIIPNLGKVYYKALSAGVSDARPKRSKTGYLLPSVALATQAMAQHSVETPVPYEELRASLAHEDSSRRGVARRYLGKNFGAYELIAMTDLFKPDQPPDYVSSLLHALIIAIDQEAEGHMSPEQKRDLHREIRLIKGREVAIVDLTGAADEGVRKQARRLIQRFPIDAFGAAYDKLAEEARKRQCGEYDSPKHQGILYGGIFYYYNRIVQFGYNETFDQAERKALDVIMQKGEEISRCLKPNLRVDAASLLFAKAFAYSRHKGTSLEAPQHATLFLNAIKDQASKYYSASHIETAERISKL